jgi:catechol 2,3-dioxygenase-like lactoylglutathione lyase family enzyme
MLLKKLHHVAYRCHDAQETVDFYTNVLDLKLALTLVQDFVPSIQLTDPHTHIFFKMEDGSFIAFFDILSSDDEIIEDKRDWAQHLALEVSDVDTLLAAKKRLEDAGVDVVGPTDHGICQSIYFHDPTGHRLEMAARTDDPGVWEHASAEAYKVLEEWNAKKKQHAAVAQ